jgi:hypothetical protein
VYGVLRTPYSLLGAGPQAGPRSAPFLGENHRGPLAAPAAAGAEVVNTVRSNLLLIKKVQQNKASGLVSRKPGTGLIYGVRICTTVTEYTRNNYLGIGETTAEASVPIFTVRSTSNPPQNYSVQ